MLWFEQVCLPSLRAQSDPEFTLHLLLGEDFPDPWRSRLLALVQDVPQVVPTFRAAGDHRAVVREVLKSARDYAAEAVAEFRLDDDDAVAVNFVHSLRRLAPRVRRLAGATGRVALDHGKGLVLQATPEGVTARVLLTHAWAPGMAIYMDPNDPDTIMDFPHQKIWMRVPFVNLTDQVMFIRGDHGGNDAQTPWAGTGPVRMDPAEVSALLARRFHIDLARFSAAWRTIEGG